MFYIWNKTYWGILSFNQMIIIRNTNSNPKKALILRLSNENDVRWWKEKCANDKSKFCLIILVIFNFQISKNFKKKSFTWYFFFFNQKYSIEPSIIFHKSADSTKWTKIIIEDRDKTGWKVHLCWTTNEQTSTVFNTVMDNVEHACINKMGNK